MKKIYNLENLLISKCPAMAQKLLHSNIHASVRDSTNNKVAFLGVICQIHGELAINSLLD